MSDGVHIRWRETAPDRGLLSFALSELDALHSAWPETLECNIVIERAAQAADQRGAEPSGFHADVELDLGWRSPRLHAAAQSENAYGALRSAFDALRQSLRAHSVSTFASDQPVYAGDAAA